MPQPKTRKKGSIISEDCLFSEKIYGKGSRSGKAQRGAAEKRIDENTKADVKRRRGSQRTAVPACRSACALFRERYIENAVLRRAMARQNKRRKPPAYFHFLSGIDKMDDAAYYITNELLTILLRR